MKNFNLLTKFVLLILCVSIWLSFSACNKTDNHVNSQTKSPEITATPESQENNQDNDLIKPLLYQVTDENNNVIWLFGSIHVGRDDFYPLPEYVTDAFEKADSLAVEFDIVESEKNPLQMVKPMMDFVYKDGSTIKDHISEETYNEAVAILEEAGLYMSTFDMFSPVIWWNLIDSVTVMNNGGDEEKGIDRHMILSAYEKNKPVVSIESAESQLAMLGSFSEKLQILLLEESLEMNKNPQNSEELNELMDAWAAGDEKAISESDEIEEELTDEEMALYEEYYNKMLTERNIFMTEFAENSLKNGEKTFICVGAAHVVGEGGMADLLKEKGYSVRVVR